MAAKEWDDAASVDIPVRPGWRIHVRLKHDQENLYFSFASVKNGKERLFPEILLDPHDLKSSRWQRGQWWFHVSANLCEGNGEANVYRKNGAFQCAHRKVGWEGNNPPTSETDIIEIKIAYSKIDVSPTVGSRLGLAFGVTNATGDQTQKWFLWPTAANIEYPHTWGEAILK